MVDALYPYAIDLLHLVIQSQETTMAGLAARKSFDNALLSKFDKALLDDTDAQCELFLKSFIFDLGDEWKKVVELSTSFKKFLLDAGDENDCSCIQAAHFLQKNGKTRTGLQRKEELRDVDLNFDDRISFLEYLLLHYKPMILKAYYGRREKSCPYDLTKGGVGVTGVGNELLTELFTFPAGLPADLQRALDEFFATKRARAKKLEKLNKKAALPGVRGLTAKNEIAQLLSQSSTEMNRLEITLNAAKRRAMKKSGGETASEALAKKQAVEEAKKVSDRKAARARLKAKAAMFDQSSKDGSNQRRIPSFLKKSRAMADGKEV